MLTYFSASVWNTIVAGAKLIGYNSYIKTYRQSGGLKQAVKDFEALEPKNVKILVYLLFSLSNIPQPSFNQIAFLSA